MGPGAVAPMITPGIVLTAILLLLLEYLYIVARWGVGDRSVLARRRVIAMIIVAASAVPQAIVLVVASFLWAIMLPIAAISILILGLKLARQISRR
jgi:hypothetical protein